MIAIALMIGATCGACAGMLAMLLLDKAVLCARCSAALDDERDADR